MRKAAVMVCVFWGIVATGCNSKVDREIDCSTFETSSSSIGHMVGKLADALENTETLDAGLLQIRAYLEANAGKLEACTRQLENGFMTMSSEEILRFNEAFVQRQDVTRFLDAQDHLQEVASQAQTQELEELMSSFPFFSE